ncbi:MAG: class I SAM-dependent methyltransferase [Caulobacteraceae bacterium]
MDHLKLSLVAHSSHHFSSPVSAETLDRVLALSGVGHGWRAADLGCGPGAMALHLAERYGVKVEAVDRSATMLDLARARAADNPAGKLLSFYQAESTEWLATAAPCDLVMAVGAGLLVPGAADNAAQLRALAAAVRPDGRLLWGETFWKKEPSAGFRAGLGPVAALYASHADYVAAGEAAGLTPLYAAVSSDQDWDEYAWRYSTAVETYAAERPDDAEAHAMRARIAGWRRMYLAEGRETMGFGLYLFAKPLASITGTAARRRRAACASAGACLPGAAGRRRRCRSGCAR